MGTSPWLMAVFRLPGVRGGGAERVPHGLASRVAGAGEWREWPWRRVSSALRRIERDSLVACAVLAAAAAVLTRRLDAPLGVLGGGALVAISYRGIKAGIAALLMRASAEEASGPAAGRAARGRSRSGW